MIGMESWFCSGAMSILVWGDNSQLEIKVVILRFHTFLEKIQVTGEEVVVGRYKRGGRKDRRTTETGFAVKGWGEGRIDSKMQHSV